MQAIYPIKVQAIQSKGQKARFYVYVPLPLAAAIGLEHGEEVQWSLKDKDTLEVKRHRPAKGKTASQAKKGGKMKKTAKGN
jgi:hypothetical protein